MLFAGYLTNEGQGAYMGPLLRWNNIGEPICRHADGHIAPLLFWTLVCPD